MSTQRRKKMAELLLVVALFIATAVYLAYSPLFPG
jgi:hypothetical protein